MITPNCEVYQNFKKLYLPEIKTLLKKKNFEQENLLEKEAKTIFDTLFQIDSSKEKFYSKLFLDWYIRDSFEEDSLEDIIDYANYLKKTCYKSNQTKYHKTYIDFLINQKTICLISVYDKLKTSLKPFVHTEKAFDYLFDFPKDFIIFENTKIKIVFGTDKRYDLGRSFPDDNILEIDIDDLPEKEKKDLIKKIITLKKGCFKDEKDTFDFRKVMKFCDESGQNILNENLWPYLKESKTPGHIDELDYDFQKKIKNHGKHFEIFQKKVDLISTLFEKKILAQLIYQKNSKHYLLNIQFIEDQEQISPEKQDIKIMRKFLNVKNLPIFEKNYMEPKKGIVSDYTKVKISLFFWGNPVETTAHERFMMKKKFFSKEKS